MKTAYRTSAAAVIIVMLFLLMQVAALATSIDIKITIRTEAGTDFELDTNTTDSIDSIRAKIQIDKEIPTELQLLYFNGTLLVDGNTLRDYNILGGSTIDLVVIKAITGFTISGQIGSSVIGADTVTLTMPHGTDLTSLAPVITVSAGATISPLSGVAQNFTSPVMYTVTAGWDSSIKTYTVTVNVAEPDQTDKEYDVISNPVTWTGAGDVVWEIDAPYNEFVRLRLDGGTVGEDCYIVTEGSTVITFRESYIKTLPNGVHAFRAEFENGYAELAFTVNVSPKGLDDVPKTGDSAIDVPKTGIESNFIFWISICIASLGLGVTISLKLRKSAPRR